MAGRFLKVAGLLCGGVLALGTGATGSHFAQPLLESSFYPQRKNHEDLLRQSLEEKNKELSVLELDLQQLTSLNELQQTSIQGLDKQIATLDADLKNKNQEVTAKEEEIRGKEEELRAKIAENKEQETRIGTLGSDLKQKEDNLTTLTNEKTKIEKDLKSIQDRLDLTKEQILKDEALKWDLLKVDLRKIEFQSFSGGWAEFKVTDRDGSTTNFKVNQKNPTNHEQIALEIRQKGIPFKLPEGAISRWDKKIKVTRFDADYGYKQDKEENKRCYVKNKDKHIQEVTITDYFQEQYLEEAFKVYMAITKLDYFSLEYDVSAGSEKQFYFYSSSNVEDTFMKPDVIDWTGFNAQPKESDKFFIFTNRFNTMDDFLKYWCQKTIEFVRTGTVDFLDFLNPVNRSKHYKSS